MGKTIFITEKPSVAREYAKILKVRGSEKTDGYVQGYSPVIDKDVQITWAVGHLISLASVDEQRAGKLLPPTKKSERWTYDNLPIDPEVWVYKVNPQTKKQFEIIRKLYTSPGVTEIYYAGDSGREGMYIQALIRNQIFGKTPDITERVVWINSQTEDEILRGIREAKPYLDYRNMVESGYARAKDDFLIGMNFTEAFTLKAGSLVAVGRVMTPTLCMVVKRQEEIDNFKPTDYFGVMAEDMHAQWEARKGSKYFGSDALYKENGFRGKGDAEKLMAELKEDMNLTVHDVSVMEKKEMAPLLFNLADLQNFCAKALRISPAETLAIAQSLYEKKLTTYPRTDARVLSTSVANELGKKLGKKIPSKYIDDSKITDHYAIIPTFVKPVNLSSQEKFVYEAINNRFRAILMPPYIYDSISIDYIHSNKEHFYKTGKKIKQLGYKELYKQEIEDTLDDIPVKGKTYPVKSFDLNAMQTKPPTAYTTGTLITAMEGAGKLIEDEELRNQIKGCGIGTSATRAGIIEKLQKNGYITVDKKQKIAPTETGKTIIRIVESTEPALTSPEKTADMEQQLSDIVSGKVTGEEHMGFMKKYIVSTIDKIKNAKIERLAGTGKGNSVSSGKDYDCPFCKEKLKVGKFGWYCDNKDENGKSHFSFGPNMRKGHTMKESDLEDLLEKGKTKTYTFKSKEGNRPYKAHFEINKEEEKIDFDFDR